MFNNLKTIAKLNKKIKNLEELVSEHNAEWSVLYAENKQLRIENAELKMNVDLAESRTVEQARLIKAISDELNINQYKLNINQYNSIDNLIKKLKSMLSVGKHF